MSEGSLRARIFAAIAAAGTRRPGLVLALAALVTLGAALLIPGIRISTSRHALVAADNPYQARLLRFVERFGPPDSPVLVLEGGTPEARRRAIGRIARRLEEEPALSGRVLARIGPAEIAEVLLLQRPDLLGARALPSPGRELAATVEGGLPAWIGAINEQVTAGLEGGAGGEADAREGLARLSALSRALADALAGDRSAAARRLGELSGGARPGVDAEGYLTTARGDQHLIITFPDLPGDEGHHVTPLIQRVRAARDAALAEAPEGVRAHVTGLPALAADELPLIQRGLVVTSLLSTAGILLILVIAFRSLRATILCLLPIGVGTVLTLGAARLLFGELNLITSSFVSVLLGLGIDFGVYLLSRYGEIARVAPGVARAMREAMVSTGPAMVTGAITTMLAFLTTATTEFTAYAELGVITAVGLLVMVLAAMLILPALVRVGEILRRDATVPRRGPRTRSPDPLLLSAPAREEGHGLGRAAPLVRRGGRAVVALGLAAAVLAAAAISSLRFNGRYFDFLPAHTESAAGLTLLERDPLVSPIFAAATAPSVEEARALAEALRALPSVASVESATDLLPPLDEARLKALRAALAGRAPDPARLAARGGTAAEVIEKVDALADAIDEAAFALRQAGRDAAPAAEAKAALGALRERLAGLPGEGRAAIAALEGDVAAMLARALPVARRVAERGGYAAEDLPPLLRRRFASRDGAELAVYLRPRGDPWDPEVARRFRDDVVRVAPSSAGLALTIFEHERMIVAGFERAALLALALVLLIVLIDLRSARDTALVLAPLAAGWLWTLGAMRLAGLTVDVANIVALPLLLGIGVDASVHIIHRCRESAAARGGIADVEEVLRGTGRAVLVATTTTAVGFGALMAGDYGAMKSFGLLMTLGMGCCLFASVVLLPSVLVLLGRAR